jgi:hypothetical protein
MDFKIKIDLSGPSAFENTPKKEKSKKKKKGRKENGESSHKKDRNTSETPKKKKSNKRSDRKGERRPNININNNNIEVSGEKPKINNNSILSLTLPNNENLKNDQAQKLNMLANKKPRHWEKRWVLVPNVFEFTKEIWLKKWVLVDGGEDIVDNNVSLLYFIIFLSELSSTILFKLYKAL